MSYGEANSWEEKHRYRQSRPTCEKCGHDLRRGGKEGKMAGLWFCPGFDGGCWWSTPVANIKTERVENTDPHSLAETLIQIAIKRAYVAGMRRATGTSGLFSIDDDSPNVRQQSEASGASDTPANEPVVTAGPKIVVAAGAKVVPPTDIQLKELTRVTREKDIETPALVALIERLFDIQDNPPTTGNVIKTVKGMTGLQVGQLIEAATTGEVPADPLEEAIASGITLEADGMPV